MEIGVIGGVVLIAILLVCTHAVAFISGELHCLGGYHKEQIASVFESWRNSSKETQVETLAAWDAHFKAWHAKEYDGTFAKERERVLHSAD